MEVVATGKSFRNYLFFWSGQLFSLLGSMVVHFVIIWYLTITTESAMVLALANFFYFLPFIAAAPIAGVFSDRWNRKSLIITVDSLQALATFVLILLFFYNITDLWIIFIFIGIRSVFQAFHQPTVNAIIPTMVPKEKLSRINGLNFLFSGFVQLVAPMVAATLLVFLSVNKALWIDVITFYIALIPLLFISIPRVKKKAEIEMGREESFIHQFKEGFQTLKSVPGMVTLLIFAALLNFLIQPLSVLLSLFVHSLHGGQEVEYAIVSAGFQAGLILGAIITSVKKTWKRKIRITFISIALFMLGYTILALTPYKGYIFMIAITFFMGFFLPIVNTVYQTIMQTNIPHEKLGRVSSIDSTLSMVMMPIGALVAGPLAESFGIPFVFIACGILGIIITLGTYYLTGVRKLKFNEHFEIEKPLYLERE